MIRFLWALLFVVSSAYVFSQSIGIGTSSPNASAILDVSSSAKGILIPRMTTSQRAAITSPATGLIVFDTNTNSFWFFGGGAWINLISSGTGWLLNGNNGTNTAINFIGTLDNQPLILKTNNQRVGLLGTNENIFLGQGAGLNDTLSSSNIAIGTSALNNNNNRPYIIAIGYNALMSNGADASQPWEGTDNIGIGSFALASNTTGYDNTGVGRSVLANNTNGNQNTALGFYALWSNATGISNTAIGASSLVNNISWEHKHSDWRQ
jgi:hypothetical protein